MRATTPLKDFYLNDIHESNFIVNFDKGELGVIDLDSSKIRNNCVFPARYASPFSFAQYDSTKYKVNERAYGNGYIIPNDDSEIYCYVMTVLNFLCGGNFYQLKLNNYYDYLAYLKEVGIDKGLISTFEQIIKPRHNINPEPYLETLTNSQVKRARKFFEN